MLSDLGAEIIKVETRVGDISRGWGPPFVREGMSAYFYSVNRNKKSVFLNLKKPISRLAFERLLENADVLIENFKPGVLDRLGYDWQKLHRDYPKLILLSISGYGAYGPDSKNAAFDLNIQARSGLMEITGDPDGEPTKIGIPITDIGAGMYGAFSVSTALYHRRSSGDGIRIEVSMLDTAISWLSYWLTGYSVTGKELSRTGNAHTTIAPYELFDTADGKISLGVTSDNLWKKFAKAVNRPDLIEDSRFKTNASRVVNSDEVVRITSEIISRYKTSDIIRLFYDAGVPSAPLQKISEVVKDHQALARNMILDIAGVDVPGTPIKILGKDPRQMIPPPELGEHTEEVLRGVLGLTQKEYETVLSEIDDF